MSTCRRRESACVYVILLMLILGLAPVLAQPPKFKNRPLADVLRDLQAEGLRIVFTSTVVTPELRVKEEPRAATARQQLDELLAPHGLNAIDGPGALILVVPGKRARAAERRPRAEAQGTSEGHVPDAPTDRPTHQEYVSVSSPMPDRHDRGVPAETRVDRHQVEWLHGSLVDDPMRAVHNLPRVSAVDDYHSEFVVRASPFRHVDVVVDGVATPWLQHTVRGRGLSGSLTMLSSQVVDQVTLTAGAYPRRVGDRLGPQLDLTVREGSRAHLALRGALGGTNATLVGEGPIGRAARGSWLVAGRQSYLEWPGKRAARTRAAFGFSDGLVKLVFDLRTNQQVGFGVIAGVASIDGEDEEEDEVVPGIPGDGVNRAALVSFSWRSTFGPSFVLSQRASVVTHGFANEEVTGLERDRDANEEVTYRADVTRPIAHGLLEAGGLVRRTTTRRLSSSFEAFPFGGSDWSRSGYIHLAWPVAPELTVSPGLRVAGSTLSQHQAVSPWLLAEWTLHGRWTLSAAAGLSHQLPHIEQVLGQRGSTALRTERAASVDVGIEQRLSAAARWQVTVYDRREADILRERDHYPRLTSQAIVWPTARLYENALSGSSRGVELLAETHRPTGLSGFAAYSFGRARQTDANTGETFWADFDQRHALNVGGAYRFSTRASVGAIFRASSNFPIPGFFTARDGGLFVGRDRNQVRLPGYARLDVRADRRFKYMGRQLTGFLDVLNVLNRHNVGLAHGSVDPTTGAAIGFTDELFRRRVSAGLLVEFR